MLFALAGVDRDGLEGEAGLLQEKCNLCRVRRRVEIKPDHGSSSLPLGVLAY